MVRMAITCRCLHFTRSNVSDRREPSISEWATLSSDSSVVRLNAGHAADRFGRFVTVTVSSENFPVPHKLRPLHPVKSQVAKITQLPHWWVRMSGIMRLIRKATSLEPVEIKEGQINPTQKSISLVNFLSTQGENKQRPRVSIPKST